MPEVSVQGVSLHYEVTGSGDPLLVLMGQSTGPEGRAALLGGLARHYTVVTHDQRGTGRSQKVPEGFPIETLAADAIGVMDHLGIAKAHLLCHSTGCGMGHTIAANHPGRVDRLVLAAPWSHADEHLANIQALRKAAAAALAPEYYARFNALLLFPPEFRRAHAAGFARAAAHAKDHPHDAVAIAARLDAILAFDARGLWPAIKCPTLVMVARDDQIMPAWFGAAAARAITGARLVEFDGGAHMFPESRTEAFLEAVDAFLMGPSAR
ncbi:MAG: alpha/beta hydrolase [Betaproteobacteria bacterium]